MVDANVFDEHTSKIANAISDAGEEIAKATSHWLHEIDGSLVVIGQHLGEIDATLMQINNKLD